MKLELDIVEEKVTEPYFEDCIVLKVKITKDENEKIHWRSAYIKPFKENKKHELMDVLRKVLDKIIE